MSSPRFSSTAAPQMILALSEIFPLINLAHFSASPNVRLGPPTTLINAPLASETSKSSRGE